MPLKHDEKRAGSELSFANTGVRVLKPGPTQINSGVAATPLIKAPSPNHRTKSLEHLSTKYTPSFLLNTQGKQEVGCMRDVSQLDFIITSSARFPERGKIKGNLVILENDPGFRERCNAQSQSPSDFLPHWSHIPLRCPHP